MVNLNITGLNLTGLVGSELNIPWDQLAETSPVSDLAGIADGFSGDAVPASAVLDLAAPRQEATHATVIGDGGAYRASIPLPDLAAGGWLAFRLEGGPLPADKGGPFRLVVADGRTLCWNVKRVEEIRLTAHREPDDIPARPTH